MLSELAEHKAQAPASIACFVLTVSDTRTEATDTSGRAIRELLEAAGHTVTGHTIVSDEPAQVTLVLDDRLADAATQVIITTGGTGITVARRHLRSGRPRCSRSGSTASASCSGCSASTRSARRRC